MTDTKTDVYSTLDDRSAPPPKPTVMYAYVNGVLRKFDLKQ